MTLAGTESRETARLELADRVAILSLEQKVRLLTGADAFSLHPEPAVGLHRVVLSDGPAGVRGEAWDEREHSVNVPCPTALGSTWDEELVAQIGQLLAFEARRKGVDVVLAPTVNLQRTPFGGRHFEFFSEDPLLTGRIGSAFVRGLQDAGVGATVKHLVANESETERMSLDAQVDERTLRELYLAPFEEIVRGAGAWAVMAAYNGVNGQPMTESSMLQDVLRSEWGFDGLVMSDWFATRSTEASANAALDLVMPGPGGPWGPNLLDAVRAGTVDEAAIDEKVVRILRLAARVGALDGADPITVQPWSDAAIASGLRRAAAAGFVMVRNEHDLLPLDRSALRRVAVIGPNAAAARTMGGGSATVFPPYTVPPLEGLRAALGPAVAVEHSPGVTASARIAPARAPWIHQPDGSDGVEVRFLASDGTIVATERRPGGLVHWKRSGGASSPVASVEMHARVRATDAGSYTLAASGVGCFRLVVDGERVFDERLELGPDADMVEAMVIPPQAVHWVALRAGEEVDVVLAHELAPAAGGGTVASDDPHVTFQLGLRPPTRSDDEELARAVSLAAQADVAIVVVGTSAEVESEGFDRESLSLPGRQDELVRRVAEVNPRTVVVVNAGAPVLMPWAEDVASVLIAWFPGQEFGNALADVVLGLAEPGGRLPTTWPATEAGLPSTEPRNGTLSYDEGLFVGYRGDGVTERTARYPFGYGLGFTEWRYCSIDAPSACAAGAEARVTVGLRNVGGRPGREIVQVYASRRDSTLTRPLRWLVGFAVVEAAAGDEISATLLIRPRAFEHWDADGGSWAVEPGRFELFAGPSAAALPLHATVTILPAGAR